MEISYFDDNNSAFLLSLFILFYLCGHPKDI
jgi:hypothetical protein